MLLSAFPAETLPGVLNLLFKRATLAPQLQNLQRSLKRIISIVRNNNIKNNSRKEHHWALRVPRVACDPSSGQVGGHASGSPSIPSSPQGAAAGPRRGCGGSASAGAPAASADHVSSLPPAAF